LLTVLTLVAGFVLQAQIPEAETPEQKRKREMLEALQFADGYYTRAIYDRAARAYEGVVRDYPDSEHAPGAWFFWAQSLLKDGDEDGALKVYLGLGNKHADTDHGAQAILAAAGMLTARDRIAEAEPLLAKVRTDKLEESQREAVIYYLALARHAAGKVKESQADFGRLAALPVVKGRQFRLHAKYHLAQVARSAAKDDEALKRFRELAEAEVADREMALASAWQVGDILFVAGKYAEAATAYRHYLTMKPDARRLALAKVSLAWCLAQEQKHDEVVALLQNEDPATMNADGLYLLAHGNWRLRAYDAAVSGFNRLLAAYPDYRLADQAKLLVIESYNALRDHDKVIELSRDYVKERPQDANTPDVLFFLASALMDRGDREAAATAFEDALKRFWGKWKFQNEAVLRLAKLYEELAGEVKDGEDADAARKQRAKWYAKAAETYRRYDGTASPTRYREALLRAAECELSADDPARAFADFQQVVEKWPEDASAAIALMSMAQIADGKGSSEEVVRIVGQLLTSHKTHRLANKAHYLRGVAYYRMQKLNEAVLDFRVAVKGPEYEQQGLAKLFLAYALWAADRRGEALKIFEELLKAEEIRENFTPELLAEIGDQYLASNNLGAAASCYQLLAKQQNPSYRALGEIGRARTELARNNLEGAIRVLIITIKRLRGEANNPFLPIAKAYLGDAYRRRGSFDQARLELTEAIRLGTSDPKAGSLARYSMAQVLYHEAMLPTKDGREPSEQLLEEAINNAYQAFIVYSSSAVSPEAMLLVARIHDQAGRDEEVVKVGNELRKRFPVAFEAMRKRPENIKLFRHF
jgi:TolA-binding protein